MRGVLLIYLGMINLLAIILTLTDKRRAQLGKWRIPEATLMTVALLGGSIAMLISMKMVRHKTRKKKFSIGIPVMIMMQLILAAVLYWVFYGRGL